MKGLVLSGGYGKRLRPLTYSQQKQLIPVANKPILFYAIEDLIEAGIKDIAIVVGPNKEQVIETVENSDWGANIEFIYQDEPQGLAHAVKISQEFIGDDSFTMYLGDNVLKEGITDHVKKFNESSAEARILLTKVKNPQQFGVAELGKGGEVIRLIEKPKEPPSDMALVGIYMFAPIVFEALKNIKPSWRNELEITDTIQWLIDNGYNVRSAVVSGWWKDTGRPEDILDVNHLILEELKSKKEGKVEDTATVEGSVSIGKGTEIKGNSTLKGPVIIGDNCTIENSYLGPYTSIGDDCRIINTEIEGSVIMQGTQIQNSLRIIDSVIGRDVKIKDNSRPPEGHRLVIGDNSELEL